MTIRKNENKDEKIATLEQAIGFLNEIKGKVKAFILLASTDEPSTDAEKSIRGLNAVSGKMGDLIELYENIDEDIKIEAGVRGFVDALKKAAQKRGQEDNDKPKVH